MCESRLRRVVACEDSTLLVEQPGGRRERVSLLAYDGPLPRNGEFVVVHSGYALAPADADEAALALLEIARLGADPLGAPAPGEGGHRTGEAFTREEEE